MKTAAFTSMLVLAAAPLCARAAGDDAVASAGFEVPRKYDVARYMAGWERNPFSTPTPPAPPAAVESPLKDFAYTSVYGPRDTPSFTIVNTKTNDRFRLALDTPGENGLKLKSFTLGSSRKGAKLEVELGSETGTLSYAADFVKQGGGAPAGVRPGGLPGAPQGIQRPGMPGTIPVPRTTANIPRPGAPVAGRTTPPATQNRNIPVPAPSAPTVVGQSNANTTGSAPMVFGGAPAFVGNGTQAPAVVAPVITPSTGGTSAPSITVGQPVVTPPASTNPAAPRRRTLIPAQ